MSLRYLLPLSGSWLLVAIAGACPSPAAAEEPPLIPGIGPVGKVVKLHTGFKFTEGPAADRSGNVYFSDIPNERIHKVDKDGKLSVFRPKSNRANGLMVNAKGEIVACEMAGRVVAISPNGKKIRVLADKYHGKRFNAPNDLIIDKQGGVYFTDPGFGAPQPLPQGKTAVYYIAPNGQVTRLIDNLGQPNGITLSPDEKTLYVIPTGPAEMMAYPVRSPGKLGKGRVFCTLRGEDGKKGTGGDGCAMDAKGNLCVASQIGVQVFDPSGKYLGHIRFPEQPANVKFGGLDRKTLFVTARTSLYTVRMKATGHVFPAGPK
jgi:gluconolactonase